MNHLFLSVRALHILMGAVWLGFAVFLSTFLIPAIRDVGQDGGKIMIALVRRGLPTFIASLAGLQVLSGLYLYWRFTDGFDAIISGSMGGRVFGAGGVLGLAAMICGIIVGRSVKGAVALMTQAATTADPAARAALMAQAGPLRQKAGTVGTVAMVLLIVATLLMAMGHYV